jgi:hypothetical protein
MIFILMAVMAMAMAMAEECLRVSLHARTHAEAVGGCGDCGGCGGECEMDFVM